MWARSGRSQSRAGPARRGLRPGAVGRDAAPAFVLAAAIASGASALSHAQGVASQVPATAAAKAAQAPAALAACSLKPAAEGRVARVIDGRTFILDDGREVRLAAIEVAPLAAAESGAPPRDGAGLLAQRALAALALGRTVALRQAAPSADRYGRIVAFGFVVEDGRERSLQHELLAQGHARVAARVEEPGCLAALRAREREARQGALGLWGDPDYSARAADNPAAILPQRGRFAVVEGKVLSVRESGGAIYLNFARRWSEGFAAVILKRNAGALAAAGIDPKRLRGRRIEVRGFVEERGAPRVEVARPEQMAVVEDR